MDDQKRQLVKEEAVLLALKNGTALIRRELEVYGIKIDGTTEFISRSNSYDSLWEDALMALRKKFSQNKK